MGIPVWWRKKPAQCFQKLLWKIKTGRREINPVLLSHAQYSIWMDFNLDWYRSCILLCTDLLHASRTRLPSLHEYVNLSGLDTANHLPFSIKWCHLITTAAFCFCCSKYDGLWNQRRGGWSYRTALYEWPPWEWHWWYQGEAWVCFILVYRGVNFLRKHEFCILLLKWDSCRFVEKICGVWE